MTKLNHLVRTILGAILDDNQEAMDDGLMTLYDEFSDSDPEVCQAIHEIINAYSTNEPDALSHIIEALLRNAGAVLEDYNMVAAIDGMDIFDAVTVISNALP